MAISAFELFKIGIGPSSSHTVGPMRAAGMFTETLAAEGLMPRVAGLRVELFGSLGATGHGHGSVKALVLGLTGERPETVDPVAAEPLVAAVREAGQLGLPGGREIAFDPDSDIVLHRRKRLPFHSNAMLFAANDDQGEGILERTYYSIGGGFVLGENEHGAPRIEADPTPVPYPFDTAAELLGHTDKTGLPISGVMMANEKVRRDEAEIRAGLLRIWQVMQECVDAGCLARGVLPRRAEGPAPGRQPARHAGTHRRPGRPAVRDGVGDPLRAGRQRAERVGRAGGHRAHQRGGGHHPGGAALLHHVRAGCRRRRRGRFPAHRGRDRSAVQAERLHLRCRGRLPGGGWLGLLDGRGRTRRGAGGTPGQVENAAEIGIEHNLGLTCDPVGGLVQIPCIERNAIASVKAITAARMAVRGDGTHHVSLDKAIKTLRETGADMKDKYKETSRGGLAVNVIEC